MQEQKTQELIVVSETSPAAVREYRGNYELSLYNERSFKLVRDVDFGKPTEKLKRPILYKAGAEKIRWEYGVFDRYEILNAVEDWENGFFMYRFKCSLVKIFDGNEIVISEGYGSANTRESNVGNASGFDVANTKLKIAEKRSMVDAVIKMARLSSIFTQDIENDEFMNQSVALIQEKEDDIITRQQQRRIFSIAASRGLSQEQTRNWLIAAGFSSTKDIKQKDYDEICNNVGGEI